MPGNRFDPSPPAVAALLAFVLAGAAACGPAAPGTVGAPQEGAAAGDLHGDGNREEGGTAPAGAPSSAGDGEVEPARAGAEEGRRMDGAGGVGAGEEALEPGAPGSDLMPSFGTLPVPPPPGDSVALREALTWMEGVRDRGGWPAFAAGETLHPGDRDSRVPELRRRLVRSGDLSGGGVPSADSLVFDPALEAAVRRFQERHALDVDGVVGAGTRRALNVPVEDRIRQLRLNLQERRGFVPEPARRRILVDIPAFRAWILEEGREPEEHRVIVGRVDRPTPLVEGRVAHVVLAPYWNVPANILARDKLPILRSDQDYLRRQSMTVLSRATGAPVAPTSIDWAGIPSAEFNARYWLRQDPGPRNALGLVKFIFSNPHDVYLHDTPDRHLFDRGRRAFSSGCIRLQGAMDLAERLLGPVPGWGVERTRAVAAGGVETWVPLPEPVPIHTVYWTSWVGRDGTLYLADDLYGLDARRALPVLDEGMSECAVD